MRSDAPWWQRGVVYQVYPRSFADSDGDGIGDLPGITGRLDHLAALGVDAIWLSPIFRSPMRDFGYDVADYRDVDPVFGTLEDADRLIAAAHRRGIRVVLDFVPNHTSSDHEWFLDARSSRDAAHRDWYVWRDPAPDGGPPNDLLAQFGGPAWTLDEGTGQYWYHSFLPEQPDLDWRNPAVRAAMHDNLRFWFDRGVDGFRIDVLWMIAKDDAPWRDGPVAAAATGFGGDPRNALEHGDGPAMDERLRELRDVADEYPDRVLIGEVYMEPRRMVRYYGPGGRGAHLPFNTALVTLPWEAGAIRAAVEAYEAALPDGAWPNWVLGNHDQSRVATRLGAAQARVAAMLLLTLRGTPDAVLRRRARAAGRAGAARPGGGRRRAGSRALADALDHRRQRGLQQRLTPGCRSRTTRARSASRPRSAPRARCSPCTGGCWRSGAPSRRCTWARGRAWTRRRA